MTEPLDPRIRAYIAQYAEIAAESAINHFEEYVFSALASLMESGATADVIEDVCALMYECYRRGVEAGSEQAHEAWKLEASRRTKRGSWKRAGARSVEAGGTADGGRITT